MLKGKHKKVKEALLLWHQHLRKIGFSVNWPILQEKALRFSRQLEEEDSKFTSSKGWLDCFKMRFVIHPITMGGKTLSAVKEAAPLFKGYLAKLIQQKEISQKRFYDCDETGLNYKIFPTKTLAIKKEAASARYKKS